MFNCKWLFSISINQITHQWVWQRGQKWAERREEREERRVKRGTTLLCTTHLLSNCGEGPCNQEVLLILPHGCQCPNFYLSYIAYVTCESAPLHTGYSAIGDRLISYQSDSSGSPTSPNQIYVTKKQGIKFTKCSLSKPLAPPPFPTPPFINFNKPANTPVGVGIQEVRGGWGDGMLNREFF